MIGVVLKAVISRILRICLAWFFVMSVRQRYPMRNKADSEDVNRILNALLEQGNGEEIGFWVWDHMCWQCKHKAEVKKDG